MKKIPYGLANFESIKEDNQYYFVDKTKYIEKIENLGSDYLFFLRPRRFGKSLFLSILEHYYDINRKEQFDSLFGDTYIGKNPTKHRNSLPILKLNFSGIRTNASIEEIEQSFNNKIEDFLDNFFDKYKSMIPNMETVKKDVFRNTNATDYLNSFILKMEKIGLSYYLMIDEYDNFANNILIHHGDNTYKELTHSVGFLRTFFSVIKNATETRTIERLFVMGVTPLLLSDVTSGMNMGSIISNSTTFNSMLGFTQNEVKEMLDYYITQKAIPKEKREEIFNILQSTYDSYCFSENTDEKVYNSDMVLYFFNEYLLDKKIPNELLDKNVRTDYGKLRFLIVRDKKLNGNFSILKNLIETNEIDCDLTTSFSIDEIIDKEKFKSLLFYLGLVTIKEHLFATNYKFMIPNEIIRRMHFEYLRKSLRESYDLNIDIDFLKHEFINLAFKGHWRTLFEYILEQFYEASSIRDFIFKEEGVKSFMLAYLNLTPLYFIESEFETNKGYADMFFRKNFVTTTQTKYEYIIELKHITAKKLSKQEVEKQKEQAITQLKRYEESRTISEELIKIVIITSSKQVEFLGRV